MTYESMQSHESVTIHFGPNDYRRHGVVSLIEPYVIGRKVLDMRALDGALTLKCAGQASEVVSLDAYPAALKALQETAEQQGLTNIKAKHWHLDDLVPSVETSGFDCVICADVLNHVPDDSKTLADISRIIASDGRLILLVPSNPDLLGKRDQSLGHLKRYRKRELASQLEKHGFQVEKMRRWNFLALPAYFLIEKVFKKRVSDQIRYVGASSKRNLLGVVLRFWYRHIEQKVQYDPQ